MQESTAPQFDFEWDEGKRKSTLLKHGIDFLDAARIFDGRPTVHAPSKYPDGDRWIATARLSGRFVSVVYVHRNGRIRIITARRARRNEQREHHKNFPGGCDPPKG